MNYLKMFVMPVGLLVISAIGCTSKNNVQVGLNEAMVNEAIADGVSGKAGNIIVIKGQGFSNNLADVKVSFGTVEAQVISASKNSLLVKVPPHKAGKVAVVVAVNNSTSNVMLFEYKVVSILADRGARSIWPTYE
jgi:hypothetical protein